MLLNIIPNVAGSCFRSWLQDLNSCWMAYIICKRCTWYLRGLSQPTSLPQLVLLPLNAGAISVSVLEEVSLSALNARWKEGRGKGRSCCKLSTTKCTLKRSGSLVSCHHCKYVFEIGRCDYLSWDSCVITSFKFPGSIQTCFLLI